MTERQHTELPWFEQSALPRYIKWVENINNSSSWKIIGELLDILNDQEARQVFFYLKAYIILLEYLQTYTINDWHLEKLEGITDDIVREMLLKDYLEDINFDKLVIYISKSDDSFKEMFLDDEWNWKRNHRLDMYKEMLLSILSHTPIEKKAENWNIIQELIEKFNENTAIIKGFLGGKKISEIREFYKKSANDTL